MNRYGAVQESGRRIAAGNLVRHASFNRLVSAGAVAALLVTAASFLARASWLLELLTHFRLQLALGSTVLLVCALARRRLVTVALAAIAAAANAAPLMPYMLAGPASAEASAGSLRIMAANVHYRNSGYAALLEEVRRQDPDVLGLMEVDQAWLDGLSALDAKYRWQVLEPQEGPYGLALYSRLPFRLLPESPYTEDGLQTAIALELAVGESPVTLVLTHVRPPTSPGKAALRNAQFAGLARRLAEDPNEAKVLLGDLNTTPWSPYYRQLASATDMHNAALGRGYKPTWPAGFSLLKIPIDHCLVSDALRVGSFQTGTDVGSDHLPIIVDLAFREEPVSGGSL
jgi:endonuclease/exonuclease/phosphatase (EEP) superfamily protein YafD